MEREMLERQSSARRARGGAAPAAEGGAAGAMLALQRTAGNAAVASRMDAQRVSEVRVPGVQRAGLDDFFSPNPFGGGPEGPTEGGGAGTGATPETPASGDSAGGINELGPVARTGTLIADTIIASSYTPGAGNIL